MKITRRQLGSSEVLSSAEELLEKFPEAKKFIDTFSGRCVIIWDTEFECFKIYLYSENYMYLVHIKTGYCGAGYSCRKRRIMENWSRGMDLSDGDNIEETLDRIILDIAKNELVYLGDIEID